MRVFTQLSMIAIAILLQGCSGGAGSGSGQANSSATNADFRSSVVTAGAATAADGTTTSIVTVKLANADGSPVTNYTPIFFVTPATGVVGKGCTVSDASGVSTCTVTSVVAGVKNFYLTKPQTGLTSQLTFTVPGSVQTASATAGGFAGNTTDGYSVRMSLGGPLQGYNSVTRDGYKLNYFLRNANTK